MSIMYIFYRKKKEFVNVICFMAYGAKSPVSGRAKKAPVFNNVNILKYYTKQIIYHDHN